MTNAKQRHKTGCRDRGDWCSSGLGMPKYDSREGSSHGTVWGMAEGTARAGPQVRTHGGGWGCAAGAQGPRQRPWFGWWARCCRQVMEFGFHAKSDKTFGGFGHWSSTLGVNRGGRAVRGCRCGCVPGPQETRRGCSDLGSVGSSVGRSWAEATAMLPCTRAEKMRAGHAGVELLVRPPLAMPSRLAAISLILRRGQG